MISHVEKCEQDKFDIGAKLRREREASGLSQDQLADVLGSTRSAVSRYENGEREMGIVTFTQYADALSIDPAKLLPSRFQYSTNNKGKLDELADLTSGLTDDDLEILIMMAKRMKQSKPEN